MSPDDERPTDAIDVAVPDPDDHATITDEKVGPGSDVGGYVIDGQLGQGGMGVVYSATHPLIGKRAAIKILRLELSKDPSAVERFINEARAVNQIGHPNIVDIFAFGTLPDGRSYYVMDLLGGESLRARLKRGALHISEAATVIDETASALTAAHVKGIIHRDLKPDNVFMVNVAGRWPEVKLLDFGLAKLVALRRGWSGSDSLRPAGMTNKVLTITGSVMGTPAYMSPEQARSSDLVDHRTDVYSLGVMAYELLAGTAPFKKPSSIDTLLAHQEEPVPSLREHVPGVPVELAQLIEAMLAKEPDERPTLAAVRTVIKRLKSTQIPTMTAAGLHMELPSTAARPFATEASFGPATTDEVSQHMTRRRTTTGAPPLGPPPPVGHGTPAMALATRSASTPILPGTATTLAGHSMPIPNPSPALSAALGVVPRASYPAVPVTPTGFPSASGLLPQHAKDRDATARSRRWIVIAVVAIVASAIGIAITMLT